MSWSDVVVPIAVFVAAMIALFWLRKTAYDYLTRWAQKNKSSWDVIIAKVTRGPSALWCLLLSATLALSVANISSRWQNRSENVLWSILAISLALVLYNLVNSLIEFYESKFKLPEGSTKTIRIATVVLILLVLILGLLEIWGVPTSFALVFIIVLLLAAAIALRDTIPNLFAGMQLAATGHVKAGDYIKLESGEEGYVTDISWRNTFIEGLDESIIIVPNTRLVLSTVINYGKPIKTAKEPFRFYTRMHLKELTGRNAKNLHELLNGLENLSDSVIYYHTHSFLEEHNYLTPEPANDFALWVTDSLGNEILGERLASIDTFEFSSLGSLRERLGSIIREYLSQNQDTREAPEGRELHFIKSVGVVLQTSYIAHDLREFVESLRKLSDGCLYYHIFESRLRLGRGSNDFSTWLDQSLGEIELAEQIARLDPYTYTMEGLRSSLIQLIEKRIK